MDKVILYNELLEVINKQKVYNDYDFNNFIQEIDTIYKNNDYDSLPHREQQTLLVTFFNGIGDAILISPFLRELRKTYPEAYIIFICNSEVISLFELCPYVNKVICVKTTSYVYIDLIRKSLDTVSEYLWDYQIDKAFIPHSGENNIFSLFMAYMSRAKERIGYGEFNYQHLIKDEEHNYINDENHIYDSLLTNQVEFPKDCYHEVLRSLYILGKDIKDSQLEAWCSVDDDTFAKEFLEPYQTRKIALGLGSTLALKKYPINRYIQMAKQINKIDNVTFFIFCGPTDQYDAMLFQKEIPNTVNIQVDSLRKSISLMKYMDLYIGNDTGAVHMAAVSTIPIIELNCEAKDVPKIQDYYYSSIQRFMPWTFADVYILRPDTQLPACKNKIIHGYCCGDQSSRYGHCIKQISVKNIISIYMQIFNISE